MASEWEVRSGSVLLFAILVSPFFLYRIRTRESVSLIDVIWHNGRLSLLDFDFDTAHGRTDQRCRQLSRSASFFYGVCVCVWQKISNRRRNTSQKTKIKHILPGFYWKDFFRIFGHFCAMRTAQLFDDDDIFDDILIWCRYSFIHLLEFLFGEFRLRFFILIRCPTYLFKQRKRHDEIERIKWQWCFAGDESSLKTEKRATAKQNSTNNILSFFHFFCEIRMRCLCCPVSGTYRFANSCKSTDFFFLFCFVVFLLYLLSLNVQSDDPDGLFVRVRTIQQKTSWQIKQCARFIMQLKRERFLQ